MHLSPMIVLNLPDSLLLSIEGLSGLFHDTFDSAVRLKGLLAWACEEGHSLACASIHIDCDILNTCCAYACRHGKYGSLTAPL